MLESLREASNLLMRAFGVLNVYQLSSTVKDHDLHGLATEHVACELPYLWSECDRFLVTPRDAAALGRAVLYGWRTLNPDAGAYLQRAADEYSRQHGPV